jgi:membrane-associated phospholipid phosphatase
VSDVMAGAAMVLPVIADGVDLRWNRAFLEDLTIYSQVLLVNGALNSLAKFVFQRPIPRAYAGDPDVISRTEGYLSFYSGHTSFTFAALSAASMTLNLRYRSGVWPWLVTAGVGIGVGLERVAAGRHFYTDVIAGAVMGTLVGVWVPYWHKKAPEALKYLSIRPSRDGAMLAWSRYF